jgi:flagellar biosynthesis GTPase FlhF
MHDALGHGSEPTDVSNAFLKFLLQGTKPTWQLYNPRWGFYLKRDVDEDLLEGFKKMLKAKSSRRSVIVLEGDSNTGKTTTLANLALTLRN